MKGAEYLKKIIFSSWFLAAIPAVIFVFFLPPLGSKSRLLIEPVPESLSKNVYSDLNSDSISEAIHSGKGIPYFHILIHDNDMQVYDQWNLEDTIDLNMSDFFFGNFDKDNYKEIYIFSYKDDSLFLNINEFFDPLRVGAERFYITKIGIVNNVMTSTVWPAGFFDRNGDGIDELYFCIHTGFGLEPRKVYSFDIVHNELNSSPLTGVASQFPKMVDTDGDGRPEIFGIVGASGNYKTWIPYTDWSTWLMIFDSELRFKFMPVEFPGLTNVLETHYYDNGIFQGYLISLNTGSADTSVSRPKLMIYSLDGEKIRELLFSDLGLNSHTQLVVLKSKNIDRIFLLGKEIFELNDKLEVLKKIKSPFHSYFSCYIKDIDSDGETELILYSVNEGRLIIYNASLKKIVDTKLKTDTEIFRFSDYSSGANEKKTFLSAGEYGYFLNLKRNNYYYLGYLTYPGVYFLFLLFILLIKRINTFQVVQRESLKQRLITLQLQAIKAQFDPHFTFNILNSVASLFYLEDRQAAYDYVTKFARLLRSMITDADQVYRSLDDELEFVNKYMELEKLRFGDKLNYEIEIGKGVILDERVPRHVLHTFIENSVKHGIMPADEEGRIKVSVFKEKDYLRFSIEDNGIGREKAEGHSTSTGMGLKLTKEFYDILNQLNKKPIKFTIMDLYDKTGIPSGTRAEVLVPLEDK